MLEPHMAEGLDYSVIIKNKDAVNRIKRVSYQTCLAANLIVVLF